MEQTYAVKYFVRDEEKYNAEITSDDIHNDIWDIISDVVAAANPNDGMSTSNQDFSKMLYDNAEFDTDGFCAIVGDTMITAAKTNQTKPQAATPLQQRTIVLDCVMGPRTFKEWTATVKTMCDRSHNEYRLHTNSDHVWFRLVDSANVMMTQAKYDKTAFVEYYADPVSTHTTGMDNNIFVQFAKNVKKDMVKFEIWEIPTADGTGNCKYEYTLRCGGVTQKGECINEQTIRRDPNPPSIQHDTHITISAGEFVSAVKSAICVCESFWFKVHDGKMQIVYQKDNACNYSADIPTQTCAGDADSLFSAELLKSVIGGIKDKSEILTVSLKSDLPVKIVLTDERREIIYMVAPRIEHN